MNEQARPRRPGEGWTILGVGLLVALVVILIWGVLTLRADGPPPAAPADTRSDYQRCVDSTSAILRVTRCGYPAGGGPKSIDPAAERQRIMERLRDAERRRACESWLTAETYKAANCP